MSVHWFVLLVSLATVNSSALFENIQEKTVFSPIPASNSATNTSTSSFSEKIANFPEDGLDKFKSGISSVIYNVSNLFNKTQDLDNIILGAACKVDSHCSGVMDATCDRGMCNCGPNFTVAFNMPDRCLRVAKLGETCEEDVQCLKGTVGAVCTGLYCLCSDLYKEEEGRCIPKRKLGSSCKIKDDCILIPFANCNQEGICSCPKPFISSVHNNACLTVPSPAEEPVCQEDIQCTTMYGNKTACIKNLCTCDHDFHSYNGKCEPDLKLGDKCSKSYDCLISKFKEMPNQRECYNSTCACKPGYTPVSDNQCLKDHGYQLQASLAWLLCIFFLPYFI